MFVAGFALGESTSALHQIEAPAFFDAIDPLGQADERGQWRGQRAFIAQSQTWNTSDSKFRNSPHTCRLTGRVVASWTRLDNRKELLASFGHSAAESDLISDAMLLASAFERWGERCTDHLIGAFSFFVFDPRTRALFIARDQMGFRPLYYSRSAGLLVLSTTAAIFHQIPGLTIEPSLAWVARFITRSSMSHTETPWPQVKKLASGHQVMVEDTASASSRFEPTRYFSFATDTSSQQPASSNWVRDYRASLDEAVKCRLRTSFQLGSETTGGLDSSTCLGLAAQLSDRPIGELHAFGIIHREREPDFIFETSRMHGISHDHITHYQSRANDAVLDRSIRILGYPFEQGNAIGHEPFYRLCEDLGVRTLLSGYGGDEGVTSEAGLWYNELIQHRRFLTLWRRLRDEPGVRPVRLLKLLAKSQVRRHRPSPYANALATQWPHFALRADVIAQFDLAEDYALSSRYDEGCESIDDFVINQLNRSALPTRLENCALLANSYKVEYRWPLLDIRLIQQYLSTPSEQKRGRGMGRYLHRQAVEGAVPESIRWKTSKFMGAPLESPLVTTHTTNVKQALSTLHPLVAEAIDTERLCAIAKQLDSEPPNSVSPSAIATIRSARNIGIANRWLNKYHP